MPKNSKLEPPTGEVGGAGTPTVTPAANSDVAQARRRSPMRSLAFDVGLPILAYYGLRAIGMGAYVALLGATIAAALRLLYVLWTARQFDRFAAFMVAVFASGFAMSFVTGDARFLLAKDSVPTAVSGAIFGVSWLVGRPFMLTVAQRFGADSEAESREMDEMWTTSPGFRHVLGVMSAVWCFGLIGEAALRIPMIYLLPIDVMAAVSTAMWVVVFAALYGWTRWYGARSKSN